jgi:hypothetical protein
VQAQAANVLNARLEYDMTGSGKKRKFTGIDLILIILFIIMIYALYILFGGDWTALTRFGGAAGVESPFDRFVGSLSAFGQGIQDAFSGMVR